MQEEKILLDIIIPVFNEEKISILFELLENNVKTPFRVLLCFDSYKDKRSEFVQNETVEKINENEARVTFEITDLEGLPHLSSSEEITSKEVELGVVTEIL